MGSSIFAIDLVTSTPQKEILTGMSRYGSLGMLCCGLGVCFIYGGAAFVCRGLKYVVPAWAAMTVSLMVMAEYEMVSVIGFVTGMVGVAVMMVVNRLSDRKESMADAGQKRRLFASVLPYLLIILLSLTFFVLNPGLEISVSFPGYETLQGAVVEAKPDYVVFNILKYPFTIILLTTIASVIYYCRIGRMERKQTGLILQNTIRKIVPTETTLLFLLCTASIMMDGGMDDDSFDWYRGTDGERIPLYGFAHRHARRLYHGQQYQFQYPIRFAAGNSRSVSGHGAGTDVRCAVHRSISGRDHRSYDNGAGRSGCREKRAGN